MAQLVTSVGRRPDHPKTVNFIKVDTFDSLKLFLTTFEPSQDRPPQLFLDFIENTTHPSRGISKLIIYHLPLSIIFLIDIHFIGPIAFPTPHPQNPSLALTTILQSPSYPKALWDARPLAHTLWRDYGITLRGVRDIQLMELAARWLQPSPREHEHVKEWLSPLRPAPSDWIFSTTVRGDFGIMQDSTTIRKCLEGVAFLPGIYENLAEVLKRPENGFWREKVASSSEERMAGTRTASGDIMRQGGNAKGPWTENVIERELEAWNECIGAGRDVVF